MKTMLMALMASAALSIGGCSALQTATGPVSTVKAQQAVDLLQTTHKTVLRAELIYLMQPACGRAGSPAPPLCASYAVGQQMQRLDDTASQALVDAQKAIDTLGSNPAAIDAAVAAARLAVGELQNYTDKYKKG